jgi:hypothetical protein
MSQPKLISFFFLLLIISFKTQGQNDSTLLLLQQLPQKYFSDVDKKATRYSDRITSKTEKTLRKLVRWENKIRSLLHKTSPETEQRLFANKEMTFAGLQEKLEQGKNITEKYTSHYNEYRDKLNMSVRYVSQQKEIIDSSLVKPACRAAQKMEQLDNDVAESEAMVKFIRERKKQLVSEAVKYIGKNKYLLKINKESYYYAETLRNYKELFSDPEKTEEFAKRILSNIPSFKRFFNQNSALNSSGAAQNLSSLAGLQTRESVGNLIRDRLSAGGPDAQNLMQAQMQQAQAQFNQLKNQLLKKGSGSSPEDLPDFKPNGQRSKTFLQRLEVSSNIQFAKDRSGLLPSTADIGFGLGYKLNDRLTSGVGLSYKLGMSTRERLKISHEGIGLRSFIDWKLKASFFLTGGYEVNHMAGFKKIAELKDKTLWQQSGLLGVMKKIPFNTKMVKNTKIQLLYDFLYRSHTPVGSPLIFRMGYVF